jgi:hypothetical protein
MSDDPERPGELERQKADGDCRNEADQERGLAGRSAGFD